MTVVFFPPPVSLYGCSAPYLLWDQYQRHISAGVGADWGSGEPYSCPVFTADSSRGLGHAASLGLSFWGSLNCFRNVLQTIEVTVPDHSARHHLSFGQFVHSIGTYVDWFSGKKAESQPTSTNRARAPSCPVHSLLQKVLSKCRQLLCTQVLLPAGWGLGCGRGHLRSTQSRELSMAIVKVAEISIYTSTLLYR